MLRHDSSSGNLATRALLLDLTPSSELEPFCKVIWFCSFPVLLLLLSGTL